MHYAISTLNDSPTGRTGYRIFGEGQTEDAANEDATDHIGGRNVAKTMVENILYSNLLIVTADKLKEYGLA